MGPQHALEYYSALGNELIAKLSVSEYLKAVEQLCLKEQRRCEGILHRVYVCGCVCGCTCLLSGASPSRLHTPSLAPTHARDRSPLASVSSSTIADVRQMCCEVLVQAHAERICADAESFLVNNQTDDLHRLFVLFSELPTEHALTSFKVRQVELCVCVCVWRESVWVGVRMAVVVYWCGMRASGTTLCRLAGHERPLIRLGGHLYYPVCRRRASCVLCVL